MPASISISLLANQVNADEVSIAYILQITKCQIKKSNQKVQTTNRLQPMDNYVDFPNMPDYVSIKEAAEMLGLSANRVYEYVTEGRLSGVRAADVIMIPLEEVKRFKRGSTGRPRKTNPRWRISPDTNQQFMTLILVRIRPAQQDKLIRKLEAIKQDDQHIFPGTVARYVVNSKATPEQVVIILIWRASMVPDEAKREEALEGFRQTLADVLDWSTAQYDDGTVLMHT